MLYQDKTRQDKTRQDKTRQTNYGFLSFSFVKSNLIASVRKLRNLFRSDFDIPRLNLDYPRKPRYSLVKYFIVSFVFGIFAFSLISSFIQKPSITAVLGVAEKVLPKTGTKTSSSVLGIQDSRLTSNNGSSTTLFTFAGTNLLRNSSFEQEQGSNQPRYWTYMLDSTTSNTFRSAEGIHSGSYGLKFLGGKGAGKGLDLGISQPETKTVPGRTYTISAFIKIVNNLSTTIRLGFWDEQNNKYGEIKSFDYSQNFDWKRISYTVTTPGIITDSKNYYPIIEVRGLKDGSAMYIDDVQLEESNSPTGYNSALAYSNSAFSSLGNGAILGGLDGNLYPATSGVGGLGTSANSWNSLYLSNATIDKDGNLTVNGSSTVKGDETVNGSSTIKGNTTLGDSSSDTITTTGRFNSSLVPSATTTYDLGSSSLYWNNLYANTLNISSGQSIGGNLSVTGTFDVTGATTLSSATLSQGLGLNGGEVTSTSTSFNLLDSIVDILNLGRGATSVTLGGTTGTATIRNSTTALSGVLSVNGSGDSYFTGELGIGTTSPSFALDVNGDIRAQGGELYLTGITSSSSTTEGTVYYDTDDDQLKVYANGKWQSDRSTATKIVAASDSLNKERADYVADGTDDQVEIKAAINALPDSGGKVILLDGTIYINEEIELTDTASNNYVTLEGQGWGTILKVPDGHSSTMYVIYANGSSTTLTGIQVKNIRIDGNRSGVTNSTQFYNGVAFNNVTNSIIDGVYLSNGKGYSGDGYGFWLNNTTDITIRNSVGTDWDLEPVEIRASSRINLTNNRLQFRIELYDTSDYINISNNTLIDMQIHVGTDTSSSSYSNQVKINNNYFYSSSDAGRTTGYGVVWLARAISAEIVGNQFYLDGTNSTPNGITVADGDSSEGYHLIANNYFYLMPSNQGTSAGIYDYTKNSIITGNYCYHKSQQGTCIYLSSGSTFNSITNNYSYNPDPSNYATRVVFLASGADSNVVKNNTCNGAGDCIYVASDSNEISGNRVSGNFNRGINLTGNSNRVIDNNISGTIFVAAIADTGTGNIKRRNVGYTTEKSGTAVVANGSTSVDVTHGLSASPSGSLINIVPTNNMGNATKFWVSDVGATTFRINVNADPGADTATFNWNVAGY